MDSAFLFLPLLLAASLLNLDVCDGQVNDRLWLGLVLVEVALAPVHDGPRLFLLLDNVVLQSQTLELRLNLRLTLGARVGCRLAEACAESARLACNSLSSLSSLLLGKISIL